MKYKCFCKATNKEKNNPKYSHNWLLAKRAFFKVYDDRIVCGNWVIHNNDIEKAHVYRAKFWFFIPYYILELTIKSNTFQFGFNPWANPVKHMNIKYTECDTKLGYSFFSITIRILLISYIVYSFWNDAN